MVDAIEDLVMALVEKEHPTEYAEYVEPIYRRVLKVVEEYQAVTNPDWTFRSRFKDDIDLDSLDAIDLALELGGVLGKDISEDERKKMHSIYDLVVYFVGERKGSDKVKPLIEDAYRRLSDSK